MSGGLFSAGLFYLVIRFDLLKHVLKILNLSIDNEYAVAKRDNATDVNGSLNEKNATTEEKIRSLLIQTPVHKENRNFDGVYKVSSQS